MVRVGGWKVCGRCVEDVGLCVSMKINIKFTEKLRTNPYNFRKFTDISNSVPNSNLHCFFLGWISKEII